LQNASLREVLSRQQLSPKIARALDCLTQPKHGVRHLRDLFAPETPDVTWMQELARQGSWIILSADVVISRNPHEVRAWKEAGHPIFFLKDAWRHQHLWEQASRICHLFPSIIEYAERAKPGDAFFVPFKGQIQGP
jgi:hypothetical protein